MLVVDRRDQLRATFTSRGRTTVEAAPLVVEADAQDVVGHAARLNSTRSGGLAVGRKP